MATIILRTYTGALYVLAPGDLIRVVSVDEKEEGGGIKTAWRVGADNHEGGIVYLSRTYAMRSLAVDALNLLAEELEAYPTEVSGLIVIRLSRLLGR